MLPSLCAHFPYGSPSVHVAPKATFAGWKMLNHQLRTATQTWTLPETPLPESRPSTVVAVPLALSSAECFGFLQGLGIENTTCS